MDIIEDSKLYIEENPVISSIIIYAIISLFVGFIKKNLIIGLLVLGSLIIIEGIFYFLKSIEIVDNSFLVSLYNLLMWFLR